MTLPVTFAALSAPADHPAELFDQNFAAVGALTVIECHCATSGSALTLTPAVNAPEVNGYGTLQLFSYVADADVTSNPTIKVGGNLPKAVLDGSGITAPKIVAGTLYIVSYNPASLAGVGAFIVVNLSAPQGTRVVTAAGDIAIVDTDFVVVVDKAAPEPTTVNLPFAANKNGPVIVKDGAGNASTNNITVTPQDGDPIDGQSSFVLSANFQAVCLRPVSGLGWIIT